MKDSSAAANDLLDATDGLRRALRRALRPVWQLEPLHSTQAELLRLAESQPDITVAEAAQILRLAPNTVSTLVGKLTTAGLLRRTRSATDGRAAHLTITAAARKRLAERRDLRVEVAGRALGRMPAADRRALTAAFPALIRLAEEVENLDSAS